MRPRKRERSVVDDVLSVPTGSGGRSLAEVQAERAAQVRREERNARRREARRYRRATRPADATAPVPAAAAPAIEAAPDPLEVVRRVRVERPGPVVVLEVSRDGSVVCPMCRERQPEAVVLEHLGVPVVPERLPLAEVVARQRAVSPSLVPVDGYFRESW